MRLQAPGREALLRVAERQILLLVRCLRRDPDTSPFVMRFVVPMAYELNHTATREPESDDGCYCHGHR